MFNGLFGSLVRSGAASIHKMSVTKIKIGVFIAEPSRAWPGRGILRSSPTFKGLSLRPRVILALNHLFSQSGWAKSAWV